MLSAFSCNNSTPFTTPEILGEKIFEAIRNKDVKSFRKFIINKKDANWVIKNSDKKTAKDNVEDYVNYKIQGWASYDEKALNQLHQEGIEKGVDWKIAKFEKVEYKAKTKYIPNQADIYIHFSSNNNSYQIKLDDCLKVGRGWIIFDDITFDN